MDKLVAAKLNMLAAFETMVNKGSWVSWPDGQQYFVIRPEDFQEIIKPYDAVLDEEHEAEKTARAGSGKQHR
ncbi:hypothetical protein [Candidatus Phyllobacterium onerii]|uniref:hypothetical protein n=1 Tax=Candidatus Phyllobacterium onerii TaxID=3020828 RepID=UPI00232E0E67|nr:hypothetical protein [Phyllobacterium sp. IY22]